MLPSVNLNDYALFQGYEVDNIASKGAVCGICILQADVVGGAAIAYAQPPWEFSATPALSSDPFPPILTFPHKGERDLERRFRPARMALMRELKAD
jgi:hypothetical protein